MNRNNRLGKGMLPGLLIAVREGLEAALIVGIMLGIARKLERPDRARFVWFGTVSAVILSMLVAVELAAVSAELEGGGRWKWWIIEGSPCAGYFAHPPK
jgi:high-affinity iron transporter